MGDITGTSRFLIILTPFAYHDLRYYKDGPVIQTSITAVMPIVTLQKCVGYTNKICVHHPIRVKYPGPLDS